MPNSAQLASRTLSCWAEMGSATGLSMSVVGTLWSAVATREVGPAHGPSGQAQPVEGLGRRHLVHQVQVDEEEVGLALGRVDDVGVPDLLRQGARLAISGRPRRCGPVSMPPGRLVLDRIAGGCGR